MSKGRKTLMFKEVKYDFDNLLFLYCDSKKDEFKEGEVYNLDTGEDFDIKDLPKIYIEMNQGIIDASNHLIISKELYNVFKDILEQKLDKRILRYMEFIYAESEISGSVVYTDK